MNKIKITSRTQAQSRAMDWQQWQSEQALSMSELVEWGDYFTDLGERFNLTEEFRENGIL